MNKIVQFLEKHQPFFEKIAANTYLSAIRDGFAYTMPIILCASLFLLVSTLPGVVGIVLPQPFLDYCNKFYNYTMGVMGLVAAGSIAKALAANFNRKMPDGKTLPETSVLFAAVCGMLLLSVTSGTAKINGAEVTAFDTTYMGAKGLLSAIVAAIITAKVYRFCILHNITVKMPKEVPGTIASNFRSIFAFGFSVMACSIIDVIIRATLAVPFAEIFIKLLSPLYTASDSYGGLSIIWGSISMFWFMGVRGPSVVNPFVDPVKLANSAENLQMFLAGGQATHALTYNTDFMGELGGTGATFIVPIIFLLFMRSKQLKAVGKASVVPVMFAVNEPLLFAAPMILNPYFLVPFLLAPIFNVCALKFFIDVLGMNGFMYVLPWAIPGPIGPLLETNFQWQSFLLSALVLVVDFLIYLPFCKAYDKYLCDQEAKAVAEEEPAPVVSNGGVAAAAVSAPSGSASEGSAAPATDDAGLQKKLEGLRVLVLCAGAGTSALLANALTEGAQQLGIDITASSGAYGSHRDIMPGYDMVVLAPQVKMYYNDMKVETDKLGIKLVSTKGKQYIDLTNDPQAAVQFIADQL